MRVEVGRDLFPNRRWRPPQPAETWEGVKECKEFGPRCPQFPFDEDSFWNTREWVDKTEQSEDCLCLNVWTPARTRGEGTSMFGGTGSMRIEQFRDRVQRQYGDFTNEFFETYPVNSADEVWDVYLASVRDGWFTWQMRTWAQLMSAVDAKAYLYYFTRVPPIPESEKYGAYHGAEHVYIVGNLDSTSFTPESVDRQLSETMMGFWINFARTGDPNGGSLIRWSAYRTDTEYYMELGEEVRVGQHLLKKECDFFYGYNASKRASP